MRVKKWRVLVGTVIVTLLIYHFLIREQPSTSSSSSSIPEDSSRMRADSGKSPDSVTKAVIHDAIKDHVTIYGHVLAYQRTGSTFFGDLFNQKPSVFFLYEPLDALYTALYGTSPGWNVPSDLYTYPEGASRTLPDQEMALQQWVLSSAFTCQMSSFPTAMLLHPHWFMFRRRMHVAEKYVSCLQTDDKAHPGNLRNYLEICQKTIRQICPERFDSRHKNITLCSNVLRHEGEWTTFDKFAMKLNDWRNLLGQEVADSFLQYFQCLEQHRAECTKCARVLDGLCYARKVRIVKTVRSDMGIAETLIKDFYNYKLLHFFRDPRGSIKSRMQPNNTWSLGIGQEGNLMKASAGYCNTVVKDFKKRLKLEENYPGRIMQVIFDEHTVDPVNGTNAIHNFMHTTHLKSSTAWKRTRPLEKPKANASVIASEWQHVLSSVALKTINKQCYNFFRIIQRDWQLTK